jgi:hypothetical protein
MGSYEDIKSTDKITTDPFNALQPSNTGLDATVRNITAPNNQWLGYVLHEKSNVVTFVQIFYKPASEVVLGSTAPDFTVRLAASDSVALDFRRPIEVKGGMSAAATTTETGSTGAATATTGQFFVY